MHRGQIMKILQLDVNSVSYELVKPEAKIYEEEDVKSHRFENFILLLTSIEKGDTEKLADKAMDDAIGFARKQKSNGILIYPYAHLSDNLETQDKSLDIIKKMRQFPSKGIRIESAAFGWNKKLSIDIKGHPLAEQSRRYSESGYKDVEKVIKQDKDIEKFDTSIVRKSDWSGLPDTDHRTIGEHLDLYSAQEISPGMVYWHPNGYIIYTEIIRFLREKYEEYNYLEISTPTLANVALWHVSGHYDHYRDNMFIFDYGSEKIGMKPMNCPSTIMVYKTRKWSYRDLPFKTVIFDRLYRKEVSGALGGLTRVQEFRQDDGHIFVREDQLYDELNNVIKFVSEVYKVFGLKYVPKLSTKDPQNYMGEDSLWEKATDGLIKALESNKMKYELKEGDATFYGPKIDFDVADSNGKLWQCATIQIDYQLPLRFGITYTGEDGKEHVPILIHRAVLGTIERFIGVMVENYKGSFPTWISPEHVRIISISDRSFDYTEEIFKKLKSKHIRAHMDVSDRTMQYKIREAQISKVPYMLIIGDKEKQSDRITIRNRKGKQFMDIDLDEFIERISKEISTRSLNLSY